ncbi:L-fucose:H+ symporter permease [candidate division KSB1 bacterium]|nr:L-fucose:H+ symporter permease [candidate division KSB1 bacterium]
MPKTSEPLLKYQGHNYVLPFILLTTLFFMWGLANNMTDTLLAAFKKIMTMSDFQTSWIQVAFYGSYFCLALPAAIFIRKFTYKSGVVLGLLMFIVGAFLFYPASKTMVYGHFLATLFILAGGLSVLETTANPYVIVLGSPHNATQRLNLAQSFNPFGSIAGILLSRVFILSRLNAASALERSQMTAEQLYQVRSAELNAVMGPYVGVGIFLLLLWLVIVQTKMPRAFESSSTDGILKSLNRLIKNKNYRLGVVAQFFYVGAQIGVWSFTIRYVMNEINLNEASAAEWYLAALVLFTVSRFLFTGLMKYFKPGKLLSAAAVLGMISTLIVIFANGYPAVIALVSISGFMSLMFPTIFGIAVEGLGDDTKIGGSGLIMAILGGAVLTAVQGQVSDLTGNIHYSYIVPFICFAVILLYGLRRRRVEG